MDEALASLARDFVDSFRGAHSKLGSASSYSGVPVLTLKAAMRGEIVGREVYKKLLKSWEKKGKPHSAPKQSEIAQGEEGGTAEMVMVELHPMDVAAAVPEAEQSRMRICGLKKDGTSMPHACGRMLPETTEYFSRWGRGVGQLSPLCRDCLREHGKRIQAAGSKANQQGRERRRKQAQDQKEAEQNATPVPVPEQERVVRRLGGISTALTDLAVEVERLEHENAALKAQIAKVRELMAVLKEGM